MKALYVSALLLASTLLCAAPADLPDELKTVATPHLHIKPESISISPLGYSPSKIRYAYGLDKISSTGAGQSIAIVDAYGSPTIQDDLDTFCSKFSLPKTVVQIHYPNGVPTTTDSDWALETSLDVEWAHAIAPGATIHLIVSPNASNYNLLSAVKYAVNLGATQVSMSWGCNEFSSESKYDSYFNHPGVSFFASSGDSGAGVLWPAVSPYVTAVGGTTLWFNCFGCVYSEQAWSGSGVGTSAYVSIPSYQSPFQTSTKRMVPDVSYNANPTTGYAVYMTKASILGGWTVIGGTSAGAPQWAALMAVVNSARKSPLDQPISALYKLGDPTIRTLYFRDITSGNNGGYNAGVGYDEVTGLGSPCCANLIPMLISK